MDDPQHWLWAAAIKPFVGLALFCLLIPLVFAFRRWWPDGPLKRRLLQPTDNGVLTWGLALAVPLALVIWGLTG